MSTKYKKWGEVPCGVLAERLRELSDAIMEGPDVRDREFTQRVPAELDRDADLVLEQSAEAMDHMAYQLDQLREALEGLQSDCKQGKWIERDRWLQVSAALKATEEG